MTENAIITVSYIASAVSPKVLQNPALTIGMGAFTDLRGLDPRLVMDKIRLGGGPPRGSYLTEEPVAGLLARAVAEVLGQAGYKVKEKDADYTLTGKLANLKFHVTMGFARALLRGEITVDFSVLKNADISPAASFSVTGHGRTGSGDVVADVFKSAVEDLARQLAAHPLLAGLF